MRTDQKRSFIRFAAWGAILAGAVAWQVSVLTMTMLAVESDLLGTDGAPPLWQPLLFVFSTGLIVAAVVLLLRTRSGRFVA